jgi:hypothetical protein
MLSNFILKNRNVYSGLVNLLLFYAGSGNSTSKQVPSSTLLVTCMPTLWLDKILSVEVSPNPVPEDLLV